MAPMTPGKMRPGLYSSMSRPSDPRLSNIKANWGCDSTAKNRWRQLIWCWCTVASAVWRVTSPFGSDTCWPSSLTSKSGTSSAMRLMTCCSSASVSVIETLSRTACSAQLALRPRLTAMERAKAARSFSAFLRMSP